MSADIVVDAMGRRSQLPRWLKDAGVGPMEEEIEDSGFIYYGRYFRSLDGSIPQPYAPLLTPIGTFSILTLPGDNGTWAVGLVTASGDKPLKQLRNSDRWTAVLRSCPLHSHWLEGEPMSEMLAMGGLVDRYRRLFVNGAPLITGVALLADAYSCTNPSLGRGISLGLMHARSLRDTLAALEEDPVAFARAWDSVTEDELTPWYRETLDEDRARLGEMEALREGREIPPLSEASALRDAVIRAGMHDADLFRTYLDSRMCLARLGDAFSDPPAVARVFELADQQSRLPFPGPDRGELLRLLA
jgi:flavin-dependent dehydrogenase